MTRLDPITLRAVILRAPQYERATYLLANDWQRFIFRWPISPTTISLEDVKFAAALMGTGVTEATWFAEDFLETNKQWLSDEAVDYVKEHTDGTK